MPSTSELVVIMWDARPPAEPLGLLARQPLNLDLVWAALGLVAAVLAGVMVILWVQRWQKRSADPGTPETELENYRALLERGLLSAEEFERIRMRLEGKRPQETPPEPPANGSPRPGPTAPPQDPGKP